MNAIIETELPPSILVKDQKKKFGPKVYSERGTTYKIIATVCYDDECGNGHNSFSITADIYRKAGNGQWQDDSGGCCHEEVAKHFPNLAPFIKWHLFDANGPMHYIANTVYHATEHSPTSAWVYFEDKANGIVRQCMKYCDLPDAEQICKTAGYTMEIDPKTAKVANLDHARSTAIWPEATQDQLLNKQVLADRLPALVAEFKSAIESLGFIY